MDLGFGTRLLIIPDDDQDDDKGLFNPLYQIVMLDLNEGWELWSLTFLNS